MSQQRRGGGDHTTRHRPGAVSVSSWVAAAAFVFLGVPAFAQPVYPNQYPDQPYYSRAPQSLSGLAQQLDELALRARNQARMDRQGGHWEEVTEKLDDFAKHAHQFNALMRDRHVPSSRVNDEIRKLVDDARKVQNERLKAKWQDPQVDADWNATLVALDHLNRQYMVANNLTPQPLDIPGYTPQYSPAYGSYPPNDGAVGTSGAWTDTSTIVADLDRRADDAVRLSQNTGIAAAPDILRLRDEIRSFRQRDNSLSTRDSNASVAQMLSDARSVQAQLATPDVPVQLRDDVSAMVGSLVHLRDMANNRVEGTTDRDRDRDRDYDRDQARGTSGYENQAGIGSDRYAMMDVPQLTSELERQAAAASQIASQTDLDDIPSQMAQFRDRLRDFTNISPTDRDRRRSSLEDLLHDAQGTQRDLARRNAPMDLVNRWNAVVDLLTRLRDAS